MDGKKSKRLLVVVAKEPSPGQVKTRLVPPLSPKEAAELYRCFLQDTLEEMSGLSGECDVAIAYTPEHAGKAFLSLDRGRIGLFPQQGRDLGERLTNIFTQKLSEGYEAVAVINSDSPDLPMHLVRESFLMLDSPGPDAVFGPCDDGGYYLVAMKKVYPELFARIPWSTEDVLAATMARAAKGGIGTALLPSWNDIDTFEALLAFFRKYRARALTERWAGVKTLSFLHDLEKSGRLARPPRVTGGSHKEHYENLLAPHYTWISGGTERKWQEYRIFFSSLKLGPGDGKTALDLGAGSGFQSIPLAEAGFRVIAVDLNRRLLTELEKNASGLPIVTVEDNLLNFALHCPAEVQLMVCMGDTLTHLESLKEVQNLLERAYRALAKGGLLILEFRDLSVELTGLDRFIQVRSGAERIFSCFLEYEEDHVKVHDFLYEQIRGRWELRKSFFRKLRISPIWIKALLGAIGFEVRTYDLQGGQVTICACKPVA